MDEAATVAVIGAGPAGLAVGACLRRAGLDFVMLEKERAVGASWRRHYARLRLHTIKRYSSLPFLPLPNDHPRYVPRDLMIRYFERYAAHFDLAPRFGEAVHAVRRDAAGWTVSSTSGSLRAPFVVIASGYNAEPVVPAFAGMDTFNGKVLHSAAYVDAKPFAGQAVLVIGMGNTGAEIALDLAEAGARPTISLRDGVHVVPRELFGVPIQVMGIFASSGLLPAAVNDAIFTPILDLVLGYPARHGIRRPPLGILQQCAQAARVPVIDVGTIAKIRQRAIHTAPGISTITPGGAVFQDGSRGQYDAIILATGYRPTYRGFFDGDDIAPSNGLSNKQNASIYCVGFHNVITGLLREIGREAVAVAADISRRHAAARKAA
jgi:cation diffusion facilitator CzcD-associated flavoprotein CzcO